MEGPWAVGGSSLMLCPGPSRMGLGSDSCSPQLSGVALGKSFTLLCLLPYQKNENCDGSYHSVPVWIKLSNRRGKCYLVC